MAISICIITWNEEELLPGLLAFVDNLKGVNEICVLDSNSTDRTQDILREFKPTNGKTLKWESCEFLGFDIQRNKNMDMASNEWIWFSDGDEILSYVDDLLLELPNLSNINVIQCPHIFTLYPDRKHVLCNGDGSFLHGGPHIVKMLRKGFARFMDERKCHEILVDANGRKLYPLDGIREPGDDILRTAEDPRFKHIGIKHLSFVKSKKAREEKGQQWLRNGMIAESAKHGIPLHPMLWAEQDEYIMSLVKEGKRMIKPLPVEYWDITTNGVGNPDTKMMFERETKVEEGYEEKDFVSDYWLFEVDGMGARINKSADKISDYLLDLFSKFGVSGTVLDIGAGSGNIVHQLREKGIDAYGCEYSSSGRALSKERYGLVFPECDLRKRLPYADDAFDWSICIGVLSMIPFKYIRNAVSEILRVTKFGTLINVQTAISKDPDSWCNPQHLTALSQIEYNSLFVSCGGHDLTSIQPPQKVKYGIGIIGEFSGLLSKRSIQEILGMITKG